MPKGKIKFFNESKGYGFIEADETTDAPSVYVHHSQIVHSGYRTLKAGEAVEFDVRERAGGLEAVNVQRLP